jgi:CheY-like chemotaxis protein
MSSPLHILYLENDAADAELVLDTVASEGIVFDVTRVETESGFLAALEQGAFDVIFADYTLPSFDGLSALRIARQHRPDWPFIFVSGTLGEEVAIEALKIGATDYVLKSRLSRLVPSLQRAMREAAERACLEEAALRSESELRDLIENVPAMIFIVRKSRLARIHRPAWRGYGRIGLAKRNPPARPRTTYGELANVLRNW